MCYYWKLKRYDPDLFKKDTVKLSEQFPGLLRHIKISPKNYGKVNTNQFLYKTSVICEEEQQSSKIRAQE